MKEELEKLINRQQIVVNFDEQIIFGQLEQDESAVWSLLVASGYLKVEEIEYRGLTLEPWYQSCTMRTPPEPKTTSHWQKS